MLWNVLQVLHLKTSFCGETNGGTDKRCQFTETVNEIFNEAKTYHIIAVDL